MRILVVSNFYPPAHFGGYELECARVVEHLRARHEVRVLSSRHGRERLPPEDGVLRLLPFGRYRKLDSFKAPWWSLRAARLTRRALAAFEPELIFIWNGSQIPQVAIRIAERAGPPVAYRVCEHWFGRLYRADTFLRHLYPGDRGLRRAWAGLVRIVNRHPWLRVDVSSPVPATVSWVSEALRELSGVPATVTPLLERTLHTGIAVPPSVRRAPRPQATVGFVGRLTSEKAPDVALRALRSLEDRHGIEAALVLAGGADPEQETSLRDLAAALGVRDRVEFVGRLDPSAVADLWPQLHAVVVPSRWQEPSGTVASEAAAAGVPVVASRSGGMPEILRENEHALYFPIDDVEECARQLAEVLSDPAAATARAARARARASELSLERYLEASDRFLADSLRAHGRPTSEAFGEALPRNEVS